MRSTPRTGDHGRRTESISMDCPLTSHALLHAILNERKEGGGGRGGGGG